MPEEVTLIDLKKIIHRLVGYIVLEGKSFVSPQQRSAYIKSYINFFILTFNHSIDKQDDKIFRAILEGILKDINT